MNFAIEVEDSKGYVIGFYQESGKTWSTDDPEEAIKIANSLSDIEVRINGSGGFTYRAINRKYMDLAKHYINSKITRKDR